MPQVMRQCTTFSILILLLAIPSVVWALDRQLLLGGDLFYAHEFIDESGPGTGAGLHVSYGLTDAVAVGGILGWAGHFADAGDDLDLRHTVTAAAGMYFVLDVIRVVPYLGILTGAAVSIDEEVRPGYLLDIRGGADVIVTPSFMFGIELTYQLVVGRDILPARLVASIRFSWRKIFF